MPECLWSGTILTKSLQLQSPLGLLTSTPAAQAWLPHYGVADWLITVPDVFLLWPRAGQCQRANTVCPCLGLGGLAGFQFARSWLLGDANSVVGPEGEGSATHVNRQQLKWASSRGSDAPGFEENLAGSAAICQHWHAFELGHPVACVRFCLWRAAILRLHLGDPTATQVTAPGRGARKQQRRLVGTALSATLTTLRVETLGLAGWQAGVLGRCIPGSPHTYHGSSVLQADQLCNNQPDCLAIVFQCNGCYPHKGMRVEGAHGCSRRAAVCESQERAGVTCEVDMEQ